MHLLAADWVRFGRRRDLRFVVVLLPVILAVMFVIEFNTLTTPPQADFFFDPPDPVAEADMRAQMLAEWRDRLVVELPAFTFPASLVKVSGNIGPLALLAIYLAIALVAAEFEWGTVRTLHLTSSRGRTLAVRTGVVVGMVAVATALGLVLAAIIPFLLSVEGRPLQDYAEPVPGLLSEVGMRILAVLPFVSIPILIAVLTRSMSLAFLLTVLFFVADLALTGSAQFWQARRHCHWIPAMTVTGSDLAPAPRSEDQIPGLAGAAIGVACRVACLVGAAGGRRDRAVPAHRHQRIGGFPMEIVANALVVLVVAIHIYIVVLEMFLWRTERGMQAFGTDQAFADRSAPLAANQGLYNGFLVAGLIWGLLAADPIGSRSRSSS